MNANARCPRRTVAGRDLGDEYLFFDRDADEVHLLNESAREILLLCDGSRDSRALGQELSRIYDVDPARAEADANELLLLLLELGLVSYERDASEG